MAVTSATVTEPDEDANGVGFSPRDNWTLSVRMSRSRRSNLSRSGWMFCCCAKVVEERATIVAPKAIPIAKRRNICDKRDMCGLHNLR